MAFFDDIGQSFEDLNHAPWDNTMRFMDNHGEAVTKAFMIAALLYAGMGNGGDGGSLFGGGTEGGSGIFGGGGGGSGSGGAAQYGINGAQQLLKGMGGSDNNGQGSYTQPRRRGILGSPMYDSSPLFASNRDDSIDPAVQRVLFRGV